MKKQIWIAKILVILPFAVAEGAPRMISYKYTNCVACHVSPQGGGLLTNYGNGIDETQSARAREFRPSRTAIDKILSAYGHINQDIRYTTQFSQKSNVPASYSNNVAYRNTTDFVSGHRVDFSVELDTPRLLQSSRPYYGVTQRTDLTLVKALYAFRPSDGFEIELGRDYLPDGLNNQNQTSFIRETNMMGVSDFPTQAKAFFWGDSYLISPFIYGPSGQEPTGFEEKGGGLLAETALSDQAVLGVMGVYGSSPTSTRHVVGPYIRWGLDPSWGVLSETLLTMRQMNTGSQSQFNELSSYTQVYYTPLTWVVTSLTFNYLNVNEPFSESLLRVEPGLSARWSRNFTSGITMGRTFSSALDNYVLAKIYLKL
jgi:hypothetical protein